MPESVPLVERAWSTLEVKSLDAELREIEGLASTPTVDRIGDIVEPMGAKFTIPLKLLHHHDHKSPVGNVIAAKSAKDGITIKAKLARETEPGPLKDRLDTAWGELKHGLIGGLSIGFKPKAYEPLDEKDPFFGGRRYTEWDWFELSLVTIPANADAQISVIRSIDQGMTAAGWQPPAIVERPSSPVVRLGATRLTQRQSLTGTLDDEPLLALRMRGWRKVGQTPVAPAEYRNGYPLYTFAYEKLG
jgi:HK97 family phage prohead protease